MTSIGTSLRAMAATTAVQKLMNRYNYKQIKRVAKAN